MNEASASSLIANEVVNPDVEVERETAEQVGFANKAYEDRDETSSHEKIN